MSFNRADADGAGAGLSSSCVGCDHDHRMDPRQPERGEHDHFPTPMATTTIVTKVTSGTRVVVVVVVVD